LFGFPVAASSDETWSVVEGLTHDADALQRLRVTTEELSGERRLVQHLL
jgi:hypothetical protein